MEFISLDDFRKEINKRFDHECMEWYDFLEFADSIPKTDAQPVIHAKWKHRKNWFRAVCSNCSFENDVESNYCPNCGANMDK